MINNIMLCHFVKKILCFLHNVEWNSPRNKLPLADIFSCGCSGLKVEIDPVNADVTVSVQ